MPRQRPVLTLPFPAVGVCVTVCVHDCFQPLGEENAFAPLSASSGEALGETALDPWGSLELLASS